MKKKYIMSPGPVPIPPTVLSLAAEPIIHHRTPEFRKAFAEVCEGLKEVFRTKQDVITLASSGTGGMECACVSLLSPGDTALVLEVGVFSNRWAKILEAYGVKAEKLPFEWGKPADPKAVAAKLKEMPQTKAVFTTLSETSTGVENDIKALAEVVGKTPAVLVVDAVSGLGAIPYYMDDWKVDCTVVGSQKGFMVPPGLAFVAMSDKAQALAKQSKLPKFYFSFLTALEKLKAEKLPDTPYTPAISLILQLRESLRLIKEEGLENCWARHARLAKATREAVKALGLKLLAPDAPSNAVTAIIAPEGIDGTEINKIFRDKYGISIAAGQGKLKGKIFRIGHLGYVDETDVIMTIGILEMVLAEIKYQVVRGQGVTAAQKVFQGL